MRWFVLFLFLCQCLQAELPLKGGGNESKPTSFAESEGGPNAFVDGVNVITGSYATTEVDAAVAVPSHFNLTRHYAPLSNETHATVRGYWCDEQDWVASSSHSNHMCVQDGYGCVKVYEKAKQEKGLYKIHRLGNGLTNTGFGLLSGQTNRKNARASHKQGWEVVEGDGTRHRFTPWKKNSIWELRTEESRPDGSHLLLTHNENGSLIRSELVSGDGSRTYAWADYKRPSLEKKKTDPFVEVHLSNGQKVQMEYSLPNHRFLKSVTPAEGPKEEYEYQGADWGDLRLLQKRILPEGRITHLQYHNDDRKPYFQRVYRVNKPIGPDGEMLPNHIFNYDIQTDRYGVVAGTTRIEDALGFISHYNYNASLRLTSIRHFDSQKKLERMERFNWGKNDTQDAGNLLLQCWQDGQEKAEAAVQYIYDERGNVIEKRLYGNLSGETPRPLIINDKMQVSQFGEVAINRYTYSNDGFNLLLSEVDPAGNEIRYAYLVNSNLLSSKMVCEGSGERAFIRERHFQIYDEDNLTIQTIKDDGITTDPLNLKGVTKRWITYTTPCKNMGAYGLPAVIEEKALDLTTGEEWLLKRIERTYTSTGKLKKEQILDATGLFVSSKNFIYNSMGLPIQESDHLGREAVYTYDANGNKLSSEWNHEDYKTLFTYDKMNRLIKTEEIHHDGHILTTSCTYDLKGNKVTETDRFGQTTTYEYNAFGQVVKVGYPAIYDGSKAVYPTCSYSYDCRGNRIEEIDCKGFKTATRYNVRGEPIQIDYPDGTTERFRYNLDGTLKKKIAPNGTITRMVYDSFKRPIEIEEISSIGESLSKKTLRYDTFHLLCETNAEGGEVHYAYDFADRQSSIKKIPPEGHVSLSEFFYDSCGRVAQVVDWVGEQARINLKEYDSDDHLVQEQATDENGKLDSKTAWIYDLSGRQIVKEQWIREDLSAVTITDYNSRGEVTAVTDPLGHKTLFFYEESTDNLFEQRILKKTVTDPLGRSKIIWHDAYGRQQKIEQRNCFNQLTESRELFYDANGNLIKAVDHVLSLPDQIKESVVTQWSYGPKNRLEMLVEAQETPLQKTTSYRYNSLGQRCELIKPDGTILHSTYDNLGRLQHYGSSDGRLSYLYRYNKMGEVIEIECEVSGFVTLRQIDSFGKLLNEEQESGAALSYQYDPIGRKNSLTLPDQSSIFWEYGSSYLEMVGRRNTKGKELYAHTYKHDLQGRWREARLIDGREIHREFDLCGRVTQIAAPEFHQEVPEGGYDAVGNQLELTTRDSFGSLHEHFSYDDRNRLIGESGKSPHNYTYDSLDNRTSKDGEAYALNALHQIEEFANEKLNYDANGNLIKRIGKDGTWLYTYDPLDRLIEVTLLNNRRISFHYDPFNRRTSKTVEHWNETQNEWNLQKHFRFLYDGQDEIGAIDESGRIIELRILGEGLGAEIGAAVACELNDEVYIPLHDMQGSVRELCDRKSKSVASYRYTTFGELEASKEEVVSPWQFSAKRIDPETGFLNFGRRYYLPDLGRWLNPDPQGFEDGPNLYAYVHNNPLAHVDLYGLIERPRDYNTKTGGWCRSAASFAVDFIAGGILDVSASLLKDRYKGCEHQAGALAGYFLKRDVPAWSQLSKGAAVALVACAGLEVVGLKGAGKVAKVCTKQLTHKIEKNCVQSLKIKNKLVANIKLTEKNITDTVINETLNGKGCFTSKHILSADQALDTGIQFLGNNYKTIGKPERGIFRSLDGTRQFRIDPNSLQGLHPPNKPHFHLEVYSNANSKIPKTNNHILFYE